jgi:hypothetical protein
MPLHFGLAKNFGVDDELKDGGHATTESVNVTHAGIIVGTRAYMSPEQARGRYTADHGDTPLARETLTR